MARTQRRFAFTMIDVGSQVGDYEVLEKLGSGGVGQVYKVRHRITGRIEALKVLSPARSMDEESRGRFLREVRVQANLQHPNIASVMTAFEFEGSLALVMELVEGESLGGYIERGRLPLDEQLRYAIQALAGLAFAHSRGVIHRDIKPENLLIGPSRTLKITDFGLAKTVTDIRLTATGTPMGSVYYISPEQVTKGDEVDQRADIYSMGAVLYQLATGRRPFRGTQAYELMRAHLEQQPIPPVELDPTIPPAYSAAILKAMSKDPNQRFATADEFSFELSMALRDAPIAAPPPTAKPAAPPATPLLAHLADRGLWRFVALIAVLSAVALVVASRSSSPDPAPPIAAAEEVELPIPAPPLDEPVAEEAPTAAPAEKPKPKPSPTQAAEVRQPVQDVELAPPPVERVAEPPVNAKVSLPATVQVRILNSFGSDSAGEIAAEVIGPAAFAGYRLGGEVIEAKSSGKDDKQSDLRIAFTHLQGDGEAIAVDTEIRGFRNSQGAPGVDENAEELKMKGGVLKRGKEVASGIGSAVGGLFGRKGNRDRASNSATFTARAARISFSPGSEFDLYVSELDSR